MNLVDLAWTTHHHGPQRAEPDVSIRFADGTVTATAATEQAARVLAQGGFTSAGSEAQYALRPGQGEDDALGAVVRAESHLFASGMSVRVDLGIATLRDIPPAPSHAQVAAAKPSTPPAKRRSR
ncbi:hypothetical protein [Streptomyces sp. NPDC057002]|uniref:hypothetical protein n=1 Tax=Streptomyces sp. NPDC057002 TaxID=3345992 RepID=UPI00362E61A6